MSHFSKDFSKSVVKSLAKKGIRIVGAQSIPDSSLSFANARRGYVVDDNGTGRVMSYDAVIMASV